MANSVYKSKNLSTEQLQFLKQLDEEEILYFNMSEIEEELDVKYNNLNEVLENLVDKDVLNRLEKGKYCRSTFTEPEVLASFISNGGVISFWSALHKHNLTDRFPNKLFVKTNYRKRNTSLFGTSVQFVYTKPEKQVGATLTGYGQNAYFISDVEATMMDCFDQPRYAGDWQDLLQAFNKAQLDPQKLITYAKFYGNQSLIKRLGYLAELFNKSLLQEFIDFALTQTGKRYVLFEPGGEEKGSFIARWKLRLNKDEKTILNAIQTPY